MYNYTYDTETGGLLLNTSPMQFSKEPRPVYYKELDLLGFDKYWTYEKQDALPYMWAEANKYYYYGRLVAQTKGGNLYTAPELDIKEELIEPLRTVDIDKMIEKNADFLQVLEQETVKKIYDVWKRYKDKLNVFHVAFSGGKDSIVLLDLVKKALPKDEFVVIFGDTQMEFPDTYDVVDKVEAQCKAEGIRFYRAKSHMDALESWRKFGPPSRIIRWCCHVHKSVPQAIWLRQELGRTYKGLDFVGVRAQESVQRSEYEYENYGKKLKGQYSHNSILEWTSAEVWLYIYYYNLIINEAYKMGNQRVGCIFCPMSAKTDYIKNVTYREQINRFVELKHMYPNEFKKLSPTNGTLDNWSKLLEEINKTKKNILQYFADQKFTSPEYIFLKHAKSTDYKSWLYLIWLKLQFSGQSYLGLVASKTDTLGSLLETAKTAILDISVSDSRFSRFYEQRKMLLKGCSDADMANFIPQIYRQGTDRIAYLTDNTKIEKQAIIVSLGEGAKAEYLKTNYPDLYAYLQDYHFDDDSLTAYFAAYKRCKVYNKIDAAFAEIVRKNATSRPYNALPSRTSVFSGIDQDKTLLIFLDAMGVEFLGYIKEVCAELKLRFVPSIARANLPTITTLNKEFYDDWKGSKEPPIKDIDDLKHHPERGYDFNNSPYPIHLPEELDVVRAALERAATKLQAGAYRKVIIASDHGASRLAVISPDVKIECSTCASKSSGRYCQGDSLPVAGNIAIENDYAVVADYSRFNGSRAASVEVHGGATLEEIVVPIIELTLANSNIQVMLENSLIEISYKKIPELILIITPDCDVITTSVNNVIYKAEKLEKSRFKVALPDLKKGAYTLDVFENQNKIASKEFTIKSKGFTERDIF